MTSPPNVPAPIVLTLPFRGRWLVQNSPARRVPSHGTELYGTRFAIDFVPVDERGRSAPRSWRSWLSVEPPEAFVGFGAPVLAPADGIVAAVHDDEPDHEARRSPVSTMGYALGQAARVRRGPAAIAGNHLIVRLFPAGPPTGDPARGSTGDPASDPAGGSATYVTLVHLRRGSLQVEVGDRVRIGDRLASCGNSGNSTEPHVHVQVTDSLDWTTARGLPLAFRRPPDHRSGGESPEAGEPWLPEESEIVEVP